MSKTTDNEQVAARQPCKTCRHFHITKNAGPDGWCESIEADVKSWWTGCVRHSPNAASERQPTKDVP
jgi:hypothetical protein